MVLSRVHAAKLYASGSITLEKAAMDADTSVREMMEYLKQKKDTLSVRYRRLR